MYRVVPKLVVGHRLLLDHFAQSKSGLGVPKSVLPLAPSPTASAH